MQRSAAFTLIELLVVCAITAVLVGLLIPAVQRVRDAGMRVQCANNLHQIGIALHHYHDSYNVLPPGVGTPSPTEQFPWMSWLTRLLPYIEQQPAWEQAQTAYQTDMVPFDNPPHTEFSAVMQSYACPADPRVWQPQTTNFNIQVGLTSYVGVAGTDYASFDGVLFENSHVRFADITDGLSNTLMVGERPPSTDFWYGWWYAGVAQSGSGSPDFVMGVRELNKNAAFLYPCAPGPYHFVSGTIQNECDVLHFWSTHFGGGHFLFCDGGVRFLGYSADPLLPALATRNGGETAQAP